MFPNLTRMTKTRVMLGSTSRIIIAWAHGWPRRSCQVVVGIVRGKACELSWQSNLIKVPELSHLVIIFFVRRYFTEKSDRSNSMETVLSNVNLWPEIKFFAI